MIETRRVMPPIAGSSPNMLQPLIRSACGEFFIMNYEEKIHVGKHSVGHMAYGLWTPGYPPAMIDGFATSGHSD